MRLHPAYILRGFLLTLGVWLLLGVVPVVQAQTTPTPVPPASSAEVRLLNELTQQVASMSESSSQTINAAVLLLGLAFIVLMLILLVVAVWVLRGGLSPLFEALRKERERAETAYQSETHMRTVKDNSDRKAEEYRAQTAQSMKEAASFMKVTAETQERMLTMLSGIESGEQAQKRTDGAVNKIIADVNTHTDSVMKDAKEILEKAAEHVEVAAGTIEGVVTIPVLKQELAPIQNQLQGIAETLRKKGDTAPLDPSKVPDTDPASTPPAEPSDTETKE